VRYCRSTPEYRLVIPGRPVSFRSRQATDYKRLVRRLAERVFHDPLSDQTVEVRIDCFHTGRRRVDMDNVAKCVMDALNDVAYVDDKQVRLQTATAHWLQEPVRIYGGPVDLVKPLAQHDEYVFIRVRGYS